MGNEIVKIYNINNEKYVIYGCWDNETPENKFDFYDVYDEVGTCLNEGNPFWEMPTRDIIIDFIKTV